MIYVYELRPKIGFTDDTIGDFCANSSPELVEQMVQRSPILSSVDPSYRMSLCIEKGCIENENAHEASPLAHNSSYQMKLSEIFAPFRRHELFLGWRGLWERYACAGKRKITILLKIYV